MYLRLEHENSTIIENKNVFINVLIENKCVLQIFFIKIILGKI